MVRTELLTGPRRDYCGKSRDSPDPGGGVGWRWGAYCGKNRHSKDKGDPAVTLSDSGGLFCTLTQRVIIMGLAAMRMY